MDNQISHFLFAIVLALAVLDITIAAVRPSVTILPDPERYGNRPSYDCTAPRVLPFQPSGFTCTSKHPSYFYNSASKKCEDAGDIECGRSRNNFLSIEKCREHCMNKKDTSVENESGAGNDGDNDNSQSNERTRDTSLLPKKGEYYDCRAPRVRPNQLPGLICVSKHETFYYNSSLNKCLEAGEIGCGRSANNFPDLKTCEKYCLDTDIIETTADECNLQHCTWYLWKHYTERGCEPVFEEGHCCPVKFECPEIFLNSTHCIHRGQIYEAISNLDTNNVCQECKCYPAFSGEEYATVSCINIECPEEFGYKEEGCIYVNKPGQCCRELVCGEEAKNYTIEQKYRLDEFTCEHSGNTYKKGESIEFPNRPCHRCKCDEDFKGPDGPGCYDIGCGYDTSIYYIKDSCVPIFRKNSCCSIDYFCHPDETAWKSYDQICQLSLDTGLETCERNMTRYYYNSHLGRCEKFSYTGCLGNMNNFKTLKNCESLCEKTNICSLPPVTEVCSDEQKTKYYYDLKTGECLPFEYSGCEANGNIFNNVQDCQLKCGIRYQQRQDANVDVCQQMPEKGPCDEERIRYYYNIENNDCQTFTYGNCKGNGNNFESSEECLSACQNRTNFNEGLWCEMGKYKFPLKHKLNTNDICLDCVCKTPPLFTCIRRKCSPPPDRDYIFCNVKQVPGFCCPHYKCFKTMEEVCKFFGTCEEDMDCKLNGPPERCIEGSCSLSCKKKDDSKESEE